MVMGVETNGKTLEIHLMIPNMRKDHPAWECSSFWNLDPAMEAQGSGLGRYKVRNLDSAHLARLVMSEDQVAKS